MPSNLPLVSIITPSYNQAQFLEATITSVLDQTYPHIEYIIIDGGSLDQSVEIIQKYQDRLVYWISERDLGQSHAINKGLKRAKGEILSWINSDDLLLPGTVERSVIYLAQHPEIDVVYGKAHRIDGLGKKLHTPRITYPTFSLKNAIGECVMTQPGAFWRRSIMDKTGLMNEELHYVMDYELWIRMALAGGLFASLDEPVANFRLSEATKTVAQLDRSGHERLKVLDTLMALPDLPNKLGLPHNTILHQEKRARSLASLKISQAHARRSGEKKQAITWLVKAIRFYPAIVFDQPRQVLAFMRDLVIS